MIISFCCPSFLVPGWMPTALFRYVLQSYDKPIPYDPKLKTSYALT